jgi:hypothetical protein
MNILKTNSEAAILLDKVIPVQAVRPLGLREVEAPTFSDIQLTDGGTVVSPTSRPHFTPHENSLYSFLLEAELTLGAQCGCKDYVN